MSLLSVVVEPRVRRDGHGAGQTVPRDPKQRRTVCWSNFSLLSQTDQESSFGCLRCGSTSSQGLSCMVSVRGLAAVRRRPMPFAVTSRARLGGAAVLVELCQSRYGQVLSSMKLGVPLGPPSKLDLLGNIHGGLLQHELAPILQAARTVGAAVLPIDRPQVATRSRVAHRLWHPRLLQGLLSYAAYSLRRQREASSLALPSDAEELRRELEHLCPAAHDVLIDERSFYLAQQVSATSYHGDMMLVCSAPMCSHLVTRLRQVWEMENPEAAADRLLRLAQRGVPVWPLYLFAYGLVPLAITTYALVCAWDSFLAPVEEVAPQQLQPA
ncbi:unnamed protein product [Durusdinium trenchii]|uniref:Uncharacterized protein n=1 Tax=Durusdinium trenchii TaxID=1381693 RepID=A0ABP0IRN1_9DINO